MRIYETIKTILLITLVLISIVLTWSLWTYQPQLKPIEKENNFIEEKPVVNQKDVSNLISPMKILFHKEDQHFGTFQEAEITKLLKNIRDWKVYDFRNISSSISKEGFTDFINKNGHIEIIFSDTIPLQMFKNFFEIDNKNQLLVPFDRVIINVYKEEQSEGSVYFVSYKDQLIYEAKINSTHITDFRTNYYPIAATYPTQVEFKLTDSNSVFLPREPITINRLSYYIDSLEVSKFVEDLFTDPNVVKKDILQTSEVYTDGSKLLRIFNDQKYIQFVNPMKLNEIHGQTSDIIYSSIDYVNEHGGWTGEYRFFSWSSEEQKTVFRLFEKNLPVFNKDGLTEIVQYWGKNEIKEYEHPLISLQILLPEVTEAKLPSGEDVIKYIQINKDFKPELVENIMIGYQLVEDKLNTRLVTLQPIWCVLYNGQWIKFDIQDSDKVEGDEDGLE